MDRQQGVPERDLDLEEYVTPRSFVYRTRGGATCRPWEGERKTLFHEPGKVMDERTKKIENPIIKMDKQSLSGVPYGEPARFKLYITNESEQPEAAYIYFDLYQSEMKNPDGARLMIDGMPLTGTGRTIEVHPGQVTEKTLEVYAGEKFDYEGLRIGVISQGDVNCYQEVAFDVHYLQTAGSMAISSPGDKWIMNCDAPTDGRARAGICPWSSAASTRTSTTSTTSSSSIRRPPAATTTGRTSAATMPTPRSTAPPAARRR